MTSDDPWLTSDDSNLNTFQKVCLYPFSKFHVHNYVYTNMNQNSKNMQQITNLHILRQTGYWIFWLTRPTNLHHYRLFFTSSEKLRTRLESRQLSSKNFNFLHDLLISMPTWTFKKNHNHKFKISRAYHVQKWSIWLVLRCSVFLKNILKGCHPKFYQQKYLQWRGCTENLPMLDRPSLIIQWLMNKIILHAHAEFPTFLWDVG